MIRAAVDIGTNSTRLYIADVTNKIKRIEKHTIITRLGKGVDNKRMLDYDSMERNIEALLEFKKIAEVYGVEEIRGITTSAARDAGNRDDFLSLIKSRTGMDIKVITGEEEARLGFIGASSILYDKPVTVIDIGGGSTEFIYGLDGSISLCASINIGAVRITERFFTSFQETSDSVKHAEAFIKEEIRDISKSILSCGQSDLVGIGGTVTTLAAVEQGLQIYDIERVHGYILHKYSVDTIFEALLKMSPEERRNLPGLQPERADIIPAGTLILKSIMEKLNKEYVIISECDNLDGFLMATYME